MDRNWLVICCFCATLTQMDCMLRHGLCLQKKIMWQTFYLTDYYNYYYGNCYQNAEGTDTQENVTTEGLDNASEVAEVVAVNKVVSVNEVASDASGQHDNSIAAKTEVCLLL